MFSLERLFYKHVLSIKFHLLQWLLAYGKFVFFFFFLIKFMERLTYRPVFFSFNCLDYKVNNSEMDRNELLIPH